MYFEYGNEALEYLTSRDKKLGEAIVRIGRIQRPVDSDLFSAVVHHIIGQQISTVAMATIWQRLQDRLGSVDAEGIVALDVNELQKFGMTFKKAEYIQDFAMKVQTKEFDIESLHDMTSAEIITALTALKGIGVWTAEMIMTFSLQRQDVISYGDLAIHRGMRMLYHHRQIDKERFAKYARRYSPYATVASLYLWAIAGGAIVGMRDYKPGKTIKK